MHLAAGISKLDLNPARSLKTLWPIGQGNKGISYQNEDAQVGRVLNVRLRRVIERMDLQQLRHQRQRQVGVTKPESLERRLQRQPKAC